MTYVPPVSAATEELPADLLRLATAIRALPEAYSRELAPALERVVESTKRRRRILTLVQDALSQLRLDMKYLMFDLEATRRRLTNTTPGSRNTRIERFRVALPRDVYNVGTNCEARYRLMNEDRSEDQGVESANSGSSLPAPCSQLLLAPWPR